MGTGLCELSKMIACHTNVAGAPHKAVAVWDTVVTVRNCTREYRVSFNSKLTVPTGEKVDQLDRGEVVAVL